MEQSETNTEPVGPFEVIQQGPCEVSTDVDPIFLYRYTNERKELKQKSTYTYMYKMYISVTLNRGAKVILVFSGSRF